MGAEPPFPVQYVDGLVGLQVLSVDPPGFRHDPVVSGDPHLVSLMGRQSVDRFHPGEEHRAGLLEGLVDEPAVGCYCRGCLFAVEVPGPLHSHAGVYQGVPGDAGVGAFNLPQLWVGVAFVHPVEEYQPRVSGGPGGVHNLAEHIPGC